MSFSQKLLNILQESSLNRNFEDKSDFDSSKSQFKFDLIYGIIQ